MTQDNRLVLVGRVAGAFGVRGEIRLTTFTEAPLSVVNYRDLRRKDGSPGLTMISGRSTNGGLIGRAKEVETKEQADRLRGTAVGAAQKSGQTVDAVLDARRLLNPTKRFGTADEFGAFCAFLCSVHAGYMTGQNVLMDGGAYPGTF